MPASHQRDFLHKLRILIEFNILIFIIITEREGHICHTACTTAPASPQKKKATKPLGYALGPYKQEKGCYINLLVELIHTDIPGYQNFVRMLPAFLDLIKERIHHCIKKSVTNFRKPLKGKLKLAITLRHLAKGDIYTSLEYNWLVGQTTICKFIPHVCQAILAEL